MEEGHNQFDYLFKFLIVGSAGCGKTCILRRYTEGKFIADMPHTIGAEFGSKIINVDSTPIKIQIWDTAGQERFRSIARSYYHDAVGALLVYDVSYRDSFVALSQWLDDIRRLASPSVVIVLVGNKMDLQETNGVVTHWEADAFAQENSLHFIETSALTGENVNEAFTHCARSILLKAKNGELDSECLGSGRNRTVLSQVAPTPEASVRAPARDTFSNECQC